MRVQKRWEGEGGLCWRVENLFIGHVKKLAKKKKKQNLQTNMEITREPESQRARVEFQRQTVGEPIASTKTVYKSGFNILIAIAPLTNFQ